MSGPITRDDALNLAAVISMVVAFLVGGAAVGMSLWTMMGKLP